jgi:hypothetical protein
MKKALVSLLAGLAENSRIIPSITYNSQIILLKNPFIFLYLKQDITIA